MRSESDTISVCERLSLRPGGYCSKRHPTYFEPLCMYVICDRKPAISPQPLTDNRLCPPDAAEGVGY